MAFVGHFFLCSWTHLVIHNNATIPESCIFFFFNVSDKPGYFTSLNIFFSLKKMLKKSSSKLWASVESSPRFGSGCVQQTVASHNTPYNFQARVRNEFAVFSRKSMSLFKPLTARNASSGVPYSCNSGGEREFILQDKHSGPQNVQLQELLVSRADSASHYHDSVQQKIDCSIHTVILPLCG